MSVNVFSTSCSPSCFLSLLLSIPYFETSAATGADVDKAVTTLLDLVMKRMEQSTHRGHSSEPNGSPAASHEVEEAPFRRRCACWCRRQRQLRFETLLISEARREMPARWGRRSFGKISFVNLVHFSKQQYCLFSMNSGFLQCSPH